MLKEALVGTHQDFTEGSLNRAIVLLAIPMVLEMVMESLFGIVDVFFVSRLGSDAIATVGLTESMLTVIFGIALGLSMATTALVARRIGEKDPDGAARSAVQAIFVGIAVSAVIGAIGIATAPQLLRLMGATPAIEANALYSRIVMGGSGVIFLLFLINAIFRGAGDATLAMRTLWLANVINIVLDPCLINGWGPFPRLGVIGAAVATTTGRGIGVLYQFRQLGAAGNRITISKRHLRLDLSVMLKLLRVSAMGILQFLIAMASWMGLMRIIATFGAAAVAGYTIAIRMLIFTILPAWGFSNAAATLVGQSLGASKPERAESAVYRTGFYNMIYLGLVSAVFLLFARQLVAPFAPEPAAANVAVACLTIFSIGQTVWAWGLVLMQAFNGAGDTTTPTIINLFAFWIFQIPLAWYLGLHLRYGPPGAFSAVPIADLVLTLTSLWLFRVGKWKRQRI